MQTATSGSLTDRLTREHRMTVDEARLILNLKKEDSADKMLQVALHCRCHLSRTHYVRRSISNIYSRPTLHPQLRPNQLQARSRHHNIGHTTSNPKWRVRASGGSSASSVVAGIAPEVASSESVGADMGCRDKSQRAV